MTAVPPRRCPVCWRLVEQTIAGNIAGHWDGLRVTTCPGSWEPYDITIAETAAALCRVPA